MFYLNGFCEVIRIQILKHSCKRLFSNYNPLYVGHLESKELLRIQPAQLFNFG